MLVSGTILLVSGLLFCLASGAAFGAMAVFGKLAYDEGAFPAMVAIAAVALGRERLDRRRAGALVLASGGGALVVAGAGAGALEPLGAALGLTAATVYSVYILVSDGIAGRVPPLVLSALVCTGAAVSLTLGSSLLGELRPGALLAFLVFGETLGGVQLLGGGLVVLAVLALNARRTILQEATA